MHTFVGMVRFFGIAIQVDGSGILIASAGLLRKH